ncbi:CrfX protein [Pseudomonas sp. NW5]|uniref:CrfX protein n=1 Tax=Pseudomonas sp. NW5 TaxID=2934934 RepID=UPI00202012F2|nr:CrfX protein [Pseudomonas sp. NW5]MCL7463364.1 CrfX protein [Pseudomonas sp. NW5]
MQDPFEASLRDLLRESRAPSAEPAEHDRLHRVLKTANRQTGAGDLLRLLGHWFCALRLAFNRGTTRPAVSVTRRLHNGAHRAHEAD